MAPSLLQLIAQIALTVLSLIACSIMAIFIHELGHVVAGILSGFRIVSVRIGPIKLARQREREGAWSLSARNQTGGVVHAQLLKTPGRFAFWQCLVFTLGGPLANLCASLILLPLSLTPRLLSIFAGLLMAISAMTGFANLIPFNIGGVGWSDGKRLFYLIFSRKKRNYLIFVYGIMASYEELKMFVKERRTQDALARIDQWIQFAPQVPGWSGERLQELIKLRERIHKQVAANSAQISQSKSVELEIDKLTVNESKVKESGTKEPDAEAFTREN